MHPKGARKANAAYIAAASPAVVLALLDVVEAAELLMYMHGQLGPEFIPHDELDLRAALARASEVMGE